MFEAQVAQGVMWKKIVEAVKELVQEANLQVTVSGLGIQAMDSAHVALVSLSLRGGGFALYECARNAMLGLNLASLSKILKTTENSDIITLRHLDDSDVLTVVAEASDKTKTSEFQLKLMEIDTETMSIPDMAYLTTISFGSAEFAKICRDMSIFGDTIMVQVNRDGVKFSASSDFGEGFVFLRAGATADVVKKETKRGVKAEKAEKVEKAEPVKGEAVKQEPGTNVKKERVDDDDTPYEKRQATNTQADASSETVTIDMVEPVTLSFALRYFTIFSKAGTLASRVTISLALEAPCMIGFEIEGLGHLRYYLAPKVEEE